MKEAANSGGLRLRLRPTKCANCPARRSGPTKQNPPRLGGGFREKRDETAGGLRHHHVSVHNRDNYDKRNER